VALLLWHYSCYIDGAAVHGAMALQLAALQRCGATVRGTTVLCGVAACDAVWRCSSQRCSVVIQNVVVLQFGMLRCCSSWHYNIATRNVAVLQLVSWKHCKLVSLQWHCLATGNATLLCNDGGRHRLNFCFFTRQRRASFYAWKGEKEREKEGELWNLSRISTLLACITQAPS
jgi:hypothetical protein